MARRNLIVFITILLFLSGLSIGYWVGIFQSMDSHEYNIGIVYPMSGRLDWWSRDAQPIIESAQRDIQKMLNQTGSAVRFNFLFADSNSTDEGALKAVKNLNSQGAQIIVGLPTSGELEAVLTYVNASQIPVISSASTASHLSIPDNVFRLSTPENYRARIGAELILKLGYTKVIVIHRSSDWGNRYAETVSDVLQKEELTAHCVSFELSHTFYMNYSREIRELEMHAQGEEDRTAIYIVAYENEDYSLLNEARKSSVLSEVRWFSAALYPSLLDRETMFGKAKDLRDFALAVELWAPEQRPIICDLTVRLMEEAKSRLGYYPSFEHIYLYDAIMIAARTFIIARNVESDTLITMIPHIAEDHFGATGHKILDENGDLKAEDTAFIGVVKRDDIYEFGYYAFHDGLRSEFSILDQPQERKWYFSPQA